MAQATYFTDGAAYEEFMGRWTLAAGAVFLDWIAAPGGARYRDHGTRAGASIRAPADGLVVAGRTYSIN